MSSNIEAGVALGILLVDHDVVDPRPWRAMPAPLDEGLHRSRTSLQHRFDPTVRDVADPTGDTQTIRLAGTAVAEPHALDPAFHP